MTRYRIAIKINELCKDYQRELKSGQFVDSFARYLADWHIAELKKALQETANYRDWLARSIRNFKINLKANEADIPTLITWRDRLDQLCECARALRGKE
jgi:hypothetical protein